RWSWCRAWNLTPGSSPAFCTCWDSVLGCLLQPQTRSGNPFFPFHFRYIEDPERHQRDLLETARREEPQHGVTFPSCTDLA
ncbi:hypothetical protein NDU88_002934, partial [Pleurodeles waltl]